MNREREANEIRGRYYRRAAKDRSSLYCPLRPSNVLSFVEKYRHFCRVLNDHFGPHSAEKRYLEIGCGTGNNLLLLSTLGVPAEQLEGNDIFAPYMAVARKRFPDAVTLREGDFLDLDYADESYDCIVLSTVLSSILDPDFRARVVTKAHQLLRPGGIVLLYDFIFNNPWNRDVRAVSASSLKRIRPWRRTCFKRVTLCPPLARRLDAFPRLIRMLSALKLLNTHLVGVLEK
jgi:SAM-dependent methyltransferase